jgi:hypothetical protein
LLAYTFWHRRNNEVSENSYEEKLIGYHASLEQSGLQGFLGSTVCKLSKVPWLPSDAEVYEDWYVLEGSEVIDKLNEVAVSGARKPGHDDIAKIAGDFRGGLYQLKIGPASNIRGKIAIWLSKPRGTTYKCSSMWMYAFESASSKFEGQCQKAKIIAGINAPSTRPFVLRLVFITPKRIFQKK